MTKPKVCGHCWYSAPNGICQKHGAPITPNSTCDSYAENPYVYDVFVDEDQFGNGSGRIVRRWGTAQLYLADVKFEDAKPHTNEPMEISFIFQPANGPGPNSDSTPRPIQPSEYQGCPGSHCGEFDHSGYYRYIPQQSGTDRADDEGDSDVQLEEVVEELEDRLDRVDSDINYRIDNWRDRVYKLEERVDTHDYGADSLLPVLVIAYIIVEVAIAAGAGIIALAVALCLFIYWIVLNALRHDARDK